MKNTKKILVGLLLAAALCMVTACGNTDKNNSGNNSAVENNQNADNSDNEKGTAGSTRDDGIVGDTGEAIKDGAEELGDDIRNGVDDAEDSMRNNGKNAMNDSNVQNNTEKNSNADTMR